MKMTIIDRTGKGINRIPVEITTLRERDATANKMKIRPTQKEYTLQRTIDQLHVRERIL